MDDTPEKRQRKDKDIEDVINEEASRGGRRPRLVQKSQGQLRREAIEQLILTRNLRGLTKLLRAERYSAEQVADVRAWYDEYWRGRPSRGR